MSTIKDIHLPFRDAWLPASFRGKPFFAEMTSRDNGRRIITHEFPKKEQPYSEDMGRKAKTFSIRAYCITYPFTMDGDKGGLYNVDYRVVRDALLAALEKIGPGTLVLSTIPQENVVVTRYRLSEEDRFGGYCTFDIEFAEYGLPPQYLTPTANTANAITEQSDAVRANATQGANATGQKTPAGDTNLSGSFENRFGNFATEPVTGKAIGPV
jgi:prophage DNA circulation protein